MKTSSFNRIKLASAAVAVIAGLAMSAPVSAQDAGDQAKIVPADQVTFMPGPGTLPAGVQVAVLHGNPAEEGAFVIRLKFPVGYAIPPHFHPEEEHVTVISGTFAVGAGEAFDAAAVMPLEPGSFVRIPTGMPHFAWVEEGAVVQINAMGPFGITYVDPKDDPRIN